MSFMATDSSAMDWRASAWRQAALCAAMALFCGAGQGNAQNARDLELGALPPIPDLRPDSEKTFTERNRLRKAALAAKAAEGGAQPQAPKAGARSLEELNDEKLMERIQSQRREAGAGGAS